MGLLDEWSRRASQRRDEKADFLAEQSGSPESTFKRDLILELTTRPDIRRAYLAKVRFGSENEASTALCLVSTRPDDRSFVTRAGEMFRRQFSKDTPFDVLFLTVEQETEIARVCAPFFRSVLQA